MTTKNKFRGQNAVIIKLYTSKTVNINAFKIREVIPPELKYNFI